MRRIARRGTTLIELVVALAVSGLVLLAAHASLGVLMHGWREARADRDRTAGYAVRLTIESWLRATVLSDSLASFAGRDGFRDGHELDTLSFEVADAGALYSGPHQITIWTDRDPLTSLDGLVAVLRPMSRSDSVADTLLLAPNAVGMDAKYLLQQDGVERWIDAWSSRVTLPFAIAIDIDLSAPRNENGSGISDASLLELPIIVSVASRRW